MVASVVLLGVAGATLASQGPGGPVSPISAAAAAEAPVFEPPPLATVPSTTVAPTTVRPTSSTSPSTSSTTSTTVKAKPVPTTAPPQAAPARVTAPVPAPTVVSQPPPVAPPSGRSAAERCAAALQWVGGQGLSLPAGWGFRCPGLALERGVPKWGVACWNCEEVEGSWIAVDIGRIGPSDVTLRYVVAHEICHARDYAGLGLSTELGADLCAALHGAPRP